MLKRYFKSAFKCIYVKKNARKKTQEQKKSGESRKKSETSIKNPES